MTNIAAVQHYGFLLLPEFSMLSFASTLEPLRMANRLAGKALFSWDIYSLDDAPVAASNGLTLTPTRRCNDVDGLGALLVVAGMDAHLVPTDDLGRWLRGLLRRGVVLGATSTGSLLLARAGVLHDQRCTIHWENAASLHEQFPLLQVTGELYELDTRVITCSGGVAGLDMTLQLIRMGHGDELARAVSEQCIHPGIRPSYGAQRMALETRWNITNGRLLDALSLMQSHLEKRLSSAELAARVGLSVRQLERLFRKNLGATPARFYSDLRLEQAHQLLQQSTMSIMQIAIACGFSSSSHFARVYRHRYGCSPRQQRQRKQSPGS